MPRKRTTQRTPLIDWQEPAPQAQALDWRRRARTYGLVPVGIRDTSEDAGSGRSAEDVGPDGTAEEDDALVTPPRQLLREDEPAPDVLDEDVVDDPANDLSEHLSQSQDAENDVVENEGAAEADVNGDVDADEPAAPVPGEDRDLVHLYLRHIGRTRLLTADEERDLGRRIDAARHALLGALAGIPGAVTNLVNLAELVRRGAAPAAELIVLDDGIERQEGSIQPVLRAFARIDDRLIDWIIGFRKYRRERAIAAAIG